MKFLRTYNQYTDEHLMKLICEKDKKAFNELYNRYAAPMKGYFKRMLWKDNEKAEDFVHDLFAKIIRKPESFDIRRSFKTWFYSVANNMCKNEYKKQEVRKNVSNGLDQIYNVYDTSTNVLNEVTDKLFKEDFEKSLVEMNAKHAEIFVLRHIQGLSIKEIAEVLDLSDGTVKSRLFYATKYLAQLLKVHDPILNRE